MITVDRLPSILKGKCPNCEVGQVFARNGNIFKLRVAEMNDDCPHCGYHFEREPGYFYGAMYVGYALTVAEAVGMYLLLYFFSLSIDMTVGIMIGGLVLLSLLNYRYSRIIWLYLFRDKSVLQEPPTT